MGMFEYKMIAIAIVAATGLVGGLLPSRLHRLTGGERWLSWGNAFSGGVFLGAGLMHLLPDSRATFASAGIVVDFPLSFMLAGLGFLGILILEKAALKGRELENMDMHAQGSSWVLFLVLSIHSIIAGISLGLETGTIASLALLIAILAHKGFAAFALGSHMENNRIERRRVLTIIAMFSIMTPLGILAGSLSRVFFSGGTADIAEAIFDGLSAGTFLYVATLEIFSETFAEHSEPRQKSFFAILGFVGMAVLAIFV